MILKKIITNVKNKVYQDNFTLKHLSHLFMYIHLMPEKTKEEVLGIFTDDAMSKEMMIETFEDPKVIVIELFK